MIFEITAKQQAKVDKWLMEEIYPPLVEEQRRIFEDAHPMMISDWGRGFPYQGAIGGGVTYQFTPTSIGVVVKAKVSAVGNVEQTLDLTDYDSF